MSVEFKGDAVASEEAHFAELPSIVVVIPSVGRPAVLHETVLSVLSQRLLPREIILPVPGMEHVDPRTIQLPRVRCIETPKGLCVQRNMGARAVAESIDLVVYFDDDVELDSRYLLVLAQAFAANPDMVVANGQLVADGGPKHRLSRADGRAILTSHSSENLIAQQLEIVPTRRLYGCHFAVRRSMFAHVQFDERMPFYGWLEDIDFGRRCEHHGRVCCVRGAWMVHLAERSGRTSGVRFGYSQIMNPAYMRTKGTFSTAECRRNWWRAVASNLAGLVLMNPTKRERLVGNFIAIGHLARGRIDPEYITRL